MTAAINFFVSMFSRLWQLLNSIVFADFFGYEVSFGGIVTALLVVSMVATVFWKGARG